MRKNRQRLLTLIFSNPDPTPMPPRPGIKRLADACPRCGCLHLNQAETDACRHQAFCHEQR